ncbi:MULTISPECIES: HAMP domain-containing sensor histidine kinase [unclassified Acidovorax]|uniref:sensor histidine kinase n=1 Tax=unclassified Acidovorax TaxID=2684926 RepID=UPI00288351F6|nr:MULTISPECIES: HAMP domain-containing sensor histidine kinase [unclassified Acidovorax]
MHGSLSARYREVKVLTELLDQRPSREDQDAAQIATLMRLASMLSSSPEELLGRVAQVALDLTGGQTAGISLQDKDDQSNPVFRWAAVRGVLHALESRVLPREASPCAVCLDAGTAVLIGPTVLDAPGQDGFPAMTERLMVPVLTLHGIPVGTLWVGVHDNRRGFTRQDARICENLAVFVGAAVKSLMDAREARQVAAEQELQEKRVENFILSLAHELRNPLSSIALAESVLRARTGSNEQLRPLDVIRAQLRRMSVMVEELVELGKIRLGIVELNLDECRVSDLLLASAQAVQAQAEAAGHRFVLEPGVPGLRIKVDSAKMVQVLVNLLTNAIKYTPEGGTIQLAATQYEQHVELRVSDTGIGLSDDQLERIFELYAQVDRKSALAADGMGIGLALVQRVVELHHGEVKAVSAGLNQGTTFLIRIPKMIDRRRSN